MKIVFLGPPGAGKGTQADIICEAHHIAHISTGDMLRGEIRNGTALGLAAKECIDKGELVPDSVIIGMVKSRIEAPDCKNGYLLDGFPRTIAQADALAGITSIDVAVNIEVPASVLVERIGGRRMCKGCGAAYHVSRYHKDVCEKCGGELYIRDDDREETVKNRISVYEKQTAPLIQYNEAKGLLRSVSGCASPDEVNTALEAILAAYR